MRMKILKLLRAVARWVDAFSQRISGWILSISGLSTR